VRSGVSSVLSITSIIHLYGQTNILGLAHNAEPESTGVSEIKVKMGLIGAPIFVHQILLRHCIWLTLAVPSSPDLEAQRVSEIQVTGVDLL